MKYLSWKQVDVTDLSVNNVSDLYSRGFVFTRLGYGKMQQTRSVRIDISRFALSSENRRILKKTAEMVGPSVIELPMKDYDYKLGKLAKDFYDTKFGPGIMSAQKVKEMLTDPTKSNFNVLLQFTTPYTLYTTPSSKPTDPAKQTPIGFAICYSNSQLLHYSYPFYDLSVAPKDMGLGMMIRAVEYAEQKGLKYIYLGSLQRPSDTYKLQFEGLEWFDGDKWQTDLDAVKKILG